MSTLLSKLHKGEDLKALKLNELPVLAEEIRTEILRVTSLNGGHVGPNLGVVELSVALHRIFSTPKDAFIFDVAHQGYVHKLLTGRQGPFFEQLRKSGGASGFLSRDESIHDVYGAGHAGTALSAALGIAKARDLKQEDDRHVIALLGDAALTCGITMEAMNNVAHTTKRLIIVLNDNEWSIARNVGAIAEYLNCIITKPAYLRFNQALGSFLKKLPGGERIRKWAGKLKKEAKDFILPAPSSLFEAYGLRYIGPIDGHDLPTLLRYLEFAKNAKEPILLHVLTQKGRGYPGALQDPEKFHGTAAFELCTGKPKTIQAGPPAYQDVFGSTLLQFAKKDPSILAITAAMPAGTGLSVFAKTLPNQFFDVGIAEEHAVLFAAGLATQGLKPVCAIYSTFLQRAFDPIVHDVCLQKLPVLFCMDRAGLSPNDGPTHHGLFDIAYLRSIPNTCIMQPKDEDELVDMMHSGLHYAYPSFIRYPRGAATGCQRKAEPLFIEMGKAELVRKGEQIVIWALGPRVQEALEIAEALSLQEGLSIAVVNARFAKPLDIKLLQKNAKEATLLVSMEDHAQSGGLGSAMAEALQESGINTPLLSMGWPDHFIPHGSSVEALRAQAGISPQAIQDKILVRYKALNLSESVGLLKEKIF